MYRPECWRKGKGMSRVCSLLLSQEFCRNVDNDFGVTTSKNNCDLKVGVPLKSSGICSNGKMSLFVS